MFHDFEPGASSNEIAPEVSADGAGRNCRITSMRAIVVTDRFRTAVAAVTLACASSAVAQSAPALPQNDCAAGVFAEYLKQNQALLSAPDATPLKSIRVAIAQRRLQEQFCMKFVACTVGEQSGRPLGDLATRSEFLSCLENESNEVKCGNDTCPPD